MRLALVFLLAACAEDPQDGGLPLLGNGTHSIDSVVYEAVSLPSHGLRTPRDLAFNPQRPDELWVVNYDASSVSILHMPSGTAGTVHQHAAPGHDHFLVHPSALAFGAPGTMATAQDHDEATQAMTPANFMGPTLWSTDPNIFDGGHAGHLDMLHNSPNSTGIAWESDNVYWVADGAHGSLTRYDFRDDHGPGGEDHSDGVVARYVAGVIGYEPGVSSHLAFDPASRLLYVADTANNRILVLDTTTGTRGSSIAPNYDGSSQYEMVGALFWTLIEGSMVGLSKPSGLEIHDGKLFVTDNATAQVHAFTLEGEPVDHVATPNAAGGIMGVAFDRQGRLYFADARAGQIFRIAPK